MRRSRDRDAARLLATAFAALAAATLVIASLETIGVSNASIVYVAAVVVIAVISGTRGAVIGAVASFLLYDFLFIEPLHTFTVSDPVEWLNLTLLLFVGIVVGQLAALQRSRAEDARAREREARALFQVSRALVTRESTVAALPAVAGVLRGEGGMERVRIALGPDDARERAAADTDPEARWSPGSIHVVLRRMPGDEPARWVRVHQPGASAAADPGRLLHRVRIEAGGRPIGSIWAWRDRRDGEPDPDGDQVARRHGRPGRTGAGPRPPPGRGPGGRDRPPERRAQVRAPAIRIPRPAHAAGDDPGRGGHPPP